MGGQIDDDTSQSSRLLLLRIIVIGQVYVALYGRATHGQLYDRFRYVVIYLAFITRRAQYEAISSQSYTSQSLHQPLVYDHVQQNRVLLETLEASHAEKHETREHTHWPTKAPNDGIDRVVDVHDKDKETYSDNVLWSDQYARQASTRSFDRHN